MAASAHPPPSEAAIRAAVAETLRQIAPEVDLSGVPDTANLRRELDLDSVDFQNFVIKISKRLSVAVSEREASQLVTLNGCLRLLRSRSGNPKHRGAETTQHGNASR